MLGLYLDHQEGEAEEERVFSLVVRKTILHVLGITSLGRAIANPELVGIG